MRPAYLYGNDVTMANRAASMSSTNQGFNHVRQYEMNMTLNAESQRTV